MGPPIDYNTLFYLAISLFQCGVQVTIPAYKDIILFFGMAAAQWPPLGFQGCNTSVRVYSSLVSISSPFAKWSVDQNSHKYTNIALYSQAKACIQPKWSTSDHASYFFLIHPEIWLNLEFEGAQYSVMRQSFRYSITEPLHTFIAVIFIACECLWEAFTFTRFFCSFTPVFLTSWNAFDLHEQHKKFLHTAPRSFGGNFLALTVSDLNCFRFSKHYDPPSSCSLLFEKLISENQPLILLICHANHIKQSLQTSQKSHSYWQY